MFYDLMWVNSRSEHFNPDRQYAFLRHQPGGNTVIVVANFDHEDLTVSVNIPAHAFDYMGIEPGNYAGREVLSGADSTLTLDLDAPVSISVPAGGAAVWVLSPATPKARQKQRPTQRQNQSPENPPVKKTIDCGGLNISL